jgi:hypothetical protein
MVLLPDPRRSQHARDHAAKVPAMSRGPNPLMFRSSTAHGFANETGRDGGDQTPHQSQIPTRCPGQRDAQGTGETAKTCVALLITQRRQCPLPLIAVLRRAGAKGRRRRQLPVETMAETTCVAGGRAIDEEPSQRNSKSWLTIASVPSTAAA